MRSSLVVALRDRGIDVRTVHDDDMSGRSDDEQLQWAISDERALYSSNVADFFKLHSEMLSKVQSHAGLILLPRQRYPVGHQLRGVLILMASLSAEAMVNRVEFLGGWIARAMR